ncbi:hypothetical protein [Lentzea albidocapillata]|uniref:Uncharacterized protein n=1 Tax=Lentzea albidocapillata TaxID=40571 RepID=A0A1W1ZJ78_9PSEU|nr:hypothetical protein [Lentzea albidocapillata]SMC48600.1 hypothetical protein SAMN05660733_00042 [Lentzea albidocapillata]
MKRVHAIWLITAAVVAAAGTITLVDRNQVAAAPPAVGEVRPVHSARDIALPLDHYQHSPADLTTIDRATAVLARQCLNDFGQSWAPPDPPPVPASTGSSRYGLVDHDQVSKSGYHPAESAPPQPEDRPEATPEAMMIYTGKGTTSIGGKRIPEGGCLGQARRELERGVPAAIPAEELIRLDQEMFEQAQRDDRVRQAMANWRKCMADSGYNYTDVWAANNDIRWDSETPLQVEIDTAKTDVTCRQRTKLVDTWLAVETAYQRRAITERAAQFDALDRGMQVRRDNAAKVLATG